jgi:hypothetical protein
MTSKKRARNRSKKAGAAAAAAGAAAATNSNRPQRQRQPLGQLDLQMQQLKVKDVVRTEEREDNTALNPSFSDESELSIPAKEPTAAAIRRSIHTSDVDNNYSKHDGIIYAGNTTHGVLHVIDSTGEGQRMHLWLGDIKLWTMAVEHIRLKYGCNTFEFEFTPFSSSQNWAKMHPELKIVGSIQLKSNSPKKQQKHDSPPKDGAIKEEDICVHGLVIPYDNEKLKETLRVCDEAAASGNINKISKLACGHLPRAEREGRKPVMPFIARKLSQWVKNSADEWDNGIGLGPINVPDDFGILIKVLMKHPEVFDNHYNNVHVQWIKSHFVSEGTKSLLRGDIDAARCNASLTWWFETLFSLFKIQGGKLDFDLSPSMKSIKCIELGYADEHTLCSFFRKRIPCSCLKKMYKEVKSVTKLRLSSFCSNKGCRQHLEKKTMMCCSLCRQATYCSRKCQKAHWTAHKINCFNMSAISQNPKEFLAEQLKPAEAVLREIKSPTTEAMCDRINKCLREERA